ncbi:MAG: hypothetical protein WBZ36_21575, partial [Candidatus Nitrosopolaris sp.]
MPSVKPLITIFVIIGITVLVGVVFFISSRPNFPARNTEKPNTVHELKPLSQIQTSNQIIRQVFLNNSTHIDTPYIKEFSLPNGTWPNSILVARNGLIWTVGIKSHTLISFDPKQGRIVSSYPITTNKEETNQSSKGFEMVWSIVEDSDGSIWIPQGGSDPLWRFDPHTGKFQVIHSISVAPMQMKADQKTGNLWFTTFDRGTFGVIQKMKSMNDSAAVGINDNLNTSPKYKIKEFNLGNGSFPSGIFLQGNSIWSTESLSNKIVQFKPIVDANGSVVNVVNILEIPQSSHSSPKDKPLLNTPADLVVVEGNDNKNKSSSVWITEHGSSFVTEYQTALHTVTRFPTSSSFRHYTTLPYWIRAAGNGSRSFWFNEHEGNRIAFFNTTNTSLTEYEVPTRDPRDAYLANALTLAVDPNNSNRTWFTEFNHDKIGVVDRSLVIPFDIDSAPNKIVITPNSGTKNNTLAKINIEITARNPGNTSYLVNSINKNGNKENNHNLILLNASSSMTPRGRLANITANFSPTSIINLTKMKVNESGRTRSVQLILERNNSTI